MTWIQTYTGRRFDLDNPDPADVDRVDIAHALSLICRFGGHTETHYSVAQHSLVVADFLSTPTLGPHITPRLQLYAVLHDAAEAYIGDVTRPLKALLPEYAGIERNIKRAIAAHFGLFGIDHYMVKRADSVALYWERRDLLGEPSEPWQEEHLSALVPDETLTPMTAQEAEAAWLRRLEQLLAEEFAS